MYRENKNKLNAGRRVCGGETAVVTLYSLMAYSHGCCSLQQCNTDHDMVAVGVIRHKICESVCLTLIR